MKFTLICNLVQGKEVPRGHRGEQAGQEGEERGAAGLLQVPTHLPVQVHLSRLLFRGRGEVVQLLIEEGAESECAMVDGWEG